MYDKVNKPKHYMLFEEHNIEVRDVLKVLVEKIKGSEYNKPMVEADYVQCMQYLMRFMEKNGIEDLEKAAWYLDKLTANIKCHTLGYNKITITDERCVIDNYHINYLRYLKDLWDNLIKPQTFEDFGTFITCLIGNSVYFFSLGDEASYSRTGKIPSFYIRNEFKNLPDDGTSQKWYAIQSQLMDKHGIK